MTLYVNLAELLGTRIEQGFYRPGDRLPSVRALSVEHGVSLSTVQQAYRMLEDNGLAMPKPKSGYFVPVGRELPALPEVGRPAQRPVEISQWDQVLELIRAVPRKDVVQLGRGMPDVLSPTLKPLLRSLARVSRRQDLPGLYYDNILGCMELREQIARLSLDSGCQLTAEDIVITTGCHEALSASIRSICEPGDIVAVDSPSFHGAMQTLKGLGMKALVRLPDDQGAYVQRILDSGADGVLIPRVRHAEDARACIDGMRFSPLGSRGLGITSRAGQWGLKSTPDYVRHGNTMVFRGVQLEDVDALQQAAQILSVDGVNAAFVGLGDLALSSGKPASHPDNVLLIDRLLELSKLEQRHHAEGRAPVALHDCAAAAIAQTRARAGQRGISLALEGHGTSGPWEAELVTLALTNLLDNAIDFAPAGSTVRVILDGATVAVQDSGPGVPDYALPRLGERFFTTARPGGERSGSGLGLAIVQRVMALHGGQMVVRNTAPGLRVELVYRAA